MFKMRMLSHLVPLSCVEDIVLVPHVVPELSHPPQVLQHTLALKQRREFGSSERDSTRFTYKRSVPSPTPLDYTVGQV